MRYWIWWNDLIQGPFELDEVTSLKAFSEDLLVCMEDREDWLPASRVADLSSAIEEAIEKPHLLSLELLQEKPSLAPALEEPLSEKRKLEWLPWILGVVLAIGALGSLGYWLIDRASTHSAITEANRLEPPRVHS